MKGLAAAALLAGCNAATDSPPAVTPDAVSAEGMAAAPATPEIGFFAMHDSRTPVRAEDRDALATPQPASAP